MAQSPSQPGTSPQTTIDAVGASIERLVQTTAQVGGDVGGVAKSAVQGAIWGGRVALNAALSLAASQCCFGFRGTGPMRTMRARPWEVVPDFLAFTETAATPFTAEHLAAAPAATGVYFLYRNGRVIYIGAAVYGTGIRQELHNHLRGSYGAPTQGASAFRYELTRDPIVAKHEYLRSHKSAYGGRLPACNTPEPATA